ncbi:beta-N-acetylhexosaminidase [Isoptericola dokdonensis]|uniref:beta-N-acetylhexosaminidase n=1 Tax=Isoptericola dokdonensis DS-3 TaxID=1300344 RepID=A0A168F317_9MICO|nr:beta-N-acetylhexosaminidase [Isoptericola dokdonensis]ANC30828.1 Beta-hexosaminidase [Isoptericola dokdonensis DS-3]
MADDTPFPAPTSAPPTVPLPARAEGGGGAVVLTDGTRLAVHPALRAAGRWWRRVTEEAFGLEIVGDLAPGPTPHDARPGSPRVAVDLDPGLPDGGYTLRTGEDGVHVTAADPAGAHAAVQTLRQLAGPDAFRRAPVRTDHTLALPAVNLTDAPAHAWRGVLLDVARHFLPTADVLRFVDLAAMHHLDVLHLHLTDDQGWRFASRRHPRLHEVGSWRTFSTVGTWRTGTPDGRPHGGHYTPDDLREIVAYARERGVMVVPEIDVPGHTQAVLAAYPHLAAQDGPHEVLTTWGVSADVLDPSEEALAVFRDVLDEVCEVFDAPFVALGGDEVPLTAWRARPDLVERAAALGLTDATGAGDVARLHGWFVARLADHLRTLGRRAVVWDEAFGPDLPGDAVVLCWRGHEVALEAMAAGHDVVLAPEQEVYLDHRASDDPDEPVPVGFVRTTADLFAFEPLPDAVRASRPDLPDDLPGRLLGAQAQVWTEHLDSARRVDYATFPRLAAFAEAVWTTRPESRAVGGPASARFLDRLDRHHLPRLDAAGVEYRPPAGPHPWQRRPGVQGHPRDLAAERAAAGWRGAGGWVEGAGDGS